MFRVVGVLEHGVDEVVLVAGILVSLTFFCFIDGKRWERNSLVFDVVGPGPVVLPLDQGRFILDIVPYSLREAIRTGAR